MLSHAEHQRSFARAILNEALPVPTGVRVPAEVVLAQRFAVYRNNVAVSLIEALRCSFPVVEQLVGPEFFAVMARLHALQSPPSSPVLLEYGSEFPDFIEQFEAAATVPYLADVARLEWQWLESYHAADAPSLAISVLDAVPRAHLPAVKLVIHPSVRFIAFSYPALTIWRLHRERPEPDRAVIAPRGEAVLLVRPQLTVEALELSPGALVFLRQIRSHRTLQAAAAAALRREPEIDMVQLLRALFAAGAFARFVDTRERRR